MVFCLLGIARSSHAHILWGSNKHYTMLSCKWNKLVSCHICFSESGAYLLYDGTVLCGSTLTLTLTVEKFETISCVPPTELVPTSIEWYDPQGQLVSRDDGDKVKQAAENGTAHLIFHSYQERQSGKYECRVTVSGNNSEKLPVCIGECYTLGYHWLLYYHGSSSVQTYILSYAHSAVLAEYD